MTDREMKRDYDVTIVGGGVAGLTAGVYTARHDLETLVLDGGSSLLRRNAHLENVPGFPAGVNSRLFLDMLEDQADRAGCEFRETAVERVREAGSETGREADDGALGRPLVTVASRSRRPTATSTRRPT
jgi:thioredoxin reductase